ncbi:MAG TPA: hypothetical protein VE130_05415 [Nitrososphaeraceae archaeon]|jgi:hypothetical protein|nr:hypothetical protein [Nitrososphaeraceae archaeon]
MSGNTHPTILAMGFIVVIVAAQVCILQSASSVPGADRTSLLIVDLHLEECIKQLQLGNADDALDHCQSADQALNALMANTTSES